jgi:hypothetical protein
MRLLGFSEAASLERERRCRVSGRGIRMRAASPDPVNGPSCVAGDRHRTGQQGLASAAGPGPNARSTPTALSAASNLASDRAWLRPARGCRPHVAAARACLPPAPLTAPSPNFGPVTANPASNGASDKERQVHT